MIERSDNTSAKYRVLIVYDVPGWAYHRRALALKKYAPPDFAVDICGSRDACKKAAVIGEYPLVMNLDYMTRGYDGIIRHYGLKTILVISHNRDSKSRLEHWPDSYRPAQACGFLICNNREVWDHHNRPMRTCNISNGVDADLWQCDVPMSERPKRILWCGSANPKKAKGWQDVLQPLRRPATLAGFECEFREFPTGGNLQQWAYPQEKQREWYGSGFAVLCTSAHEGTPNTTLEGMSCGCVAVSTNVGNIREFGKHMENCVISKRKPEAFLESIQTAWENRMALSAAGMETMRGWTYGEPGDRAAYFYQLFRRLIDDGAKSIQPFSYMDKHWSEI